jgi:hypothetical protein
MISRGGESLIVQNKEPNTAFNPIFPRYEGVNDEGQSIRQKDLQQVQNNQAQGRRSGYLR